MVDLRASPGDASFLSLSLFPPPANGSCLAKSLPFFDRNTVPATIDGAKKTSLLARRPANNLIHETLQWSSTYTTHKEHTSLSGTRNGWSARSTGPPPAARRSPWSACPSWSRTGMTSRLLPEVILENREALHHLSVACHQRRHLRLRETVGFFRGVHRQALPAHKGKIINTTCSLKLEKSAIYAYIL